jgi:hypothetical protein
MRQTQAFTGGAARLAAAAFCERITSPGRRVAAEAVPAFPEDIFNRKFQH